MTWRVVIWWPIKAICWLITPFLLKFCPNFHQHHQSSHQAPLVVLCFLPIIQPPRLSLSPITGQPPESPLLMPSLSRALWPGLCSSPSPVYHTIVPCPVRHRHSSPSLSSCTQSVIPTSPLLPSMAGPSLQVCSRNWGRPTAGGSPRLTPKSKASGRPTCPADLSA
jgi:hypothetical protein